MDITSTEAQNNFGQYLKLAQYEDIGITKNGKRVAMLTADGVAEQAGEYRARPKLTIDEFLKLNEESENRYEFIDGEVYLLASPTFMHQNIVTEILSAFGQWFRGKPCVPLTAPFDVNLYRNEDRNVVQPDVLVICDRENVNEKGKYSGVPTLVVEVLSDSTRSKDMVKKLDLYLEGGVSEYWIVNPANREVYVYGLTEGTVESYHVYKGDDVVASVRFDELQVPLADIFA